MSRTRIGAVAALSALIIVGAVLLVWAAGGDGQQGSAPGAGTAAIEARAVLEPRSVLFGDTVTARVEVTLDPRRVDADSVQVRAAFAPWRPIAKPELGRRDGDTTTFLRSTFVLRCLSSSCTSTQDPSVQVFDPARVTYTPRQEAGGARRRTLRVTWPQLVVGSRFSASDAQGSDASARRWRADVVSLPAVTYSLGPGLLSALLAGGGALLLVAAGLFVYVARRRAPRVDLTTTVPEGPVPSPLERALALLEDPARVNGAGDQRRALELVALALLERGNSTLGLSARTLAWSQPIPSVTQTHGVAAEARAAFGEDVR